MKSNPTRFTAQPAMSYSQLMGRIKRRSGSMSPAFQRVGQYVLKHYERAAFLTAAKLGRVVGVSESTIVRFALALGYPGYPELQEVLQEIVKDRLTTVDRVGLTTVDRVGLAGRRSGNGIVTQIIESDIDNLSLTLRELDREAFRKAVSIILSARRILVVGFRSAAGLALFLGFNLNWILGNVKVVGFTAQDLWEDLVHVGSDDVVIGISFPRYTEATVQALAEARMRPCKIIALTDSVMSPLGRYADVVLTARHSIPTFADSFVAPLSVINALLAAAATHTGDKARMKSRLRRLEALWDRHSIHHRDHQRVRTTTKVTRS